MSDELAEISKRIVIAREMLNGINQTNIYGKSIEEKTELEVRKAQAQIDLQRAKRDYQDFIQDEVAKP